MCHSGAYSAALGGKGMINSCGPNAKFWMTPSPDPRSQDSRLSFSTTNRGGVVISISGTYYSSSAGSGHFHYGGTVLDAGTYTVIAYGQTEAGTIYQRTATLQVT